MGNKGYSALGSFGTDTVVPTGNPVLTVAGAYSPNDYVGTSGAATELTGCAAQNGGTGWIVSSILHDGDLQSALMELWIFNAAPTPPTDNAAWSISDADNAKVVAVIPFNSYYASALNSCAPGAPIAARAFKCAAGSTSLWACLVTRGSPTFTSLLLAYDVVIIQD
jgi:hypothetical protein